MQSLAGNQGTILKELRMANQVRKIRCSMLYSLLRFMAALRKPLIIAVVVVAYEVTLVKNNVVH